MTHTTDNQTDASERSTVTDAPKKKLIEVGLPLESISIESSMDKNRRQGHPSTLHLWWSRKPLAAARAVLFAQLVDDPSTDLERFPTVEEQDFERMRLHRLIEKLIRWEDGDDPRTIEQASSNLGGLTEAHSQWSSIHLRAADLFLARRTASDSLRGQET